MKPATLYDPVIGPMPDELASKLFNTRCDLLELAKDIDAWLTEFIRETWTECHRTHLVEHQGKTLEVPGTPDFNEFDRKVHRYEKAANKLRSMLWDIKNAADGSHGHDEEA